MNKTYDPACIFCKIILHEINSPIIIENDFLVVIKDIAPKAPIHYLIITKEHVKDIQSLTSEQCDYMAETARIAQKLALQDGLSQDFKLVINSGFNAGQRVSHLHAHFLSGGQLPSLV